MQNGTSLISLSRLLYEKLQSVNEPGDEATPSVLPSTAPSTQVPHPPSITNTPAHPAVNSVPLATHPSIGQIRINRSEPAGVTSADEASPDEGQSVTSMPISEVYLPY